MMIIIQTTYILLYKIDKLSKIKGLSNQYKEQGKQLKYFEIGFNKFKSQSYVNIHTILVSIQSVYTYDISFISP